jgi:hypothetical protein
VVWYTQYGHNPDIVEDRHVGRSWPSPGWVPSGAIGLAQALRAIVQDARSRRNST